MLKGKIFHKKKEPCIIIVGAGVAGLAAASRLISNGFKDVKILEAENRLGGRVHSVSLGDSVVDLGAHWVHGEIGNVVYNLANPLNLLDHSGDFANVEFVLSNNTEIDTETGMTIFEQSGNLLEDHFSLKNCKGSVQDYLVERCKNVATELLPEPNILEAYLDWLIKFECTIEGCDVLTDASASGLTHYKQCPGDLILNWKGKGYKSIVDILLGKHKYQDINNNVSPINLEGKLFLNTEVQQVDWSGIGIIVKCKGGKVYFCDHLILTVSLGVLKERYKSLFYPPLPDDKRRAIAGLGIGTINKVYLQFPYKWWPETCSGFSIIWLKEDKVLEEGQFPWELEIIGFYTENGSPYTLTAWLAGEPARDMECCSPEQVKQGCTRVLRKFLSYKYTIPDPVDIVRTSWYSNPHFRGCYSFRSMNSDALNVTAADLAKPLKNTLGTDVLLFAGEATHNNFYSTVHGALETGWREADRIIGMYKEHDKEGPRAKL